MKAVINGIFLAKTSYEFKDKQTGEQKDNYGYYFLVYESEETYGLAKPQVVSIHVPKTESLKYADTLKIYDKCKVVMDVRKQYNGNVKTVPSDCIKA